MGAPLGHRCEWEVKIFSVPTMTNIENILKRNGVGELSPLPRRSYQADLAYSTIRDETGDVVSQERVMEIMNEHPQLLVEIQRLRDLMLLGKTDGLQHGTELERARLTTLMRQSAEVGARAPLTLHQFAQVMRPEFKFAPHQLLVANALTRVAHGEIKRLLVVAPPRSGMSDIVSRLFPAYCLYLNPFKKMALATYDLDYSKSMSNAARDIYKPVSEGKASLEESPRKWRTPEGGFLLASSVGGPLTGTGFELGIIDSPFRNPYSDSKAQERCHEWFDTAWMTHVLPEKDEPSGSLVVLETRTDANDLTGHILKNELKDPEGWHILHLSAIEEDDDGDALPEYPQSCTVERFARASGESLWEEKFPLTSLEVVQAEIGRAKFLTNYQQNPEAASRLADLASSKDGQVIAGDKDAVGGQGAPGADTISVPVATATDEAESHAGEETPNAGEGRVSEVRKSVSVPHPLQKLTREVDVMMDIVAERFLREYKGPGEVLLIEIPARMIHCVAQRLTVEGVTIYRRTAGLELIRVPDHWARAAQEVQGQIVAEPTGNTAKSSPAPQAFIAPSQPSDAVMSDGIIELPVDTRQEAPLAENLLAQATTKPGPMRVPSGLNSSFALHPSPPPLGPALRWSPTETEVAEENAEPIQIPLVLQEERLGELGKHFIAHIMFDYKKGQELFVAAPPMPEVESLLPLYIPRLSMQGIVSRLHESDGQLGLLFSDLPSEVLTQAQTVQLLAESKGASMNWALPAGFFGRSLEQLQQKGQLR
jgi:hypothetical protein